MAYFVLSTPIYCGILNAEKYVFFVVQKMGQLKINFFCVVIATPNQSSRVGFGKNNIGRKDNNYDEHERNDEPNV